MSHAEDHVPRAAARRAQSRKSRGGPPSARWGGTPFDEISKATGIEDVRIHDIRRSFGLRIARTAGLHVASKLLRHHSVTQTERAYAPLGLDDLREALKKANEAQPAKVVDIAKAREAKK